MLFTAVQLSGYQKNDLGTVGTVGTHCGDALVTGKTQLAINFPGAKHHAQLDHSSGFCIFNDFAIAANIASKDHGKNIIIIDIDAHHGDGAEDLTQIILKFSPSRSIKMESFLVQEMTASLAISITYHSKQAQVIKSY